MTTDENKTLPSYSAPDYLITQTEAAGILGVSRTTFWRMKKKGVLSPVKIHNTLTRYKMSDIQALIKNLPVVNKTVQG